jgi:hypothetical protein
LVWLKRLLQTVALYIFTGQYRIGV